MRFEPQIASLFVFLCVSSRLKSPPENKWRQTVKSDSFVGSDSEAESLPSHTKKQQWTRSIGAVMSPFFKLTGVNRVFFFENHCLASLCLRSPIGCEVMWHLNRTFGLKLRYKKVHVTTFIVNILTYFWNYLEKAFEKKIQASHLFWIRAITCEYVFPRTVSPFTFTSLSPAQARAHAHTHRITIISICIICTVLFGL